MRTHFGQYISGPVLDFGCGFGRHFNILKEFTNEIHGVDINQWALDKARESEPNGQFWLYQGGDLPFSDKTFKTIMSWTVLQHVPAPEIYALGKEFDRVLGPGGHILLFENVTVGTGHEAVYFRPTHFYRMLWKDYIQVKVKPIFGIDGNTEMHALIVLQKPGE
jgi:ubiquinone/menaquinone biosynthesis C-methylase UbiE